MRNIVKRVLEYFLHEHDLETIGRHITYRQDATGEGWKEPGTWLHMTWFQTCRKCKALVKTDFSSGL